MPLEKPDYRNNLERIIERYPDKELLTVKEVCDFLGLGYRTVKKMYPFKGHYISKAALARCLS